MHDLPHHDIVSKIAEEAATINGKYTSINGQFQQYEKDVKKYGDYLVKYTAERETIRDEGNMDNEANQEQKQIIEVL